MAVEPEGSGTATDETGESPYKEGDEVDILAIPDPVTEYQFVNWTAPAGSFEDATEPDTTFTMPGEDVTVTANLAQPGDSVPLGTACNYVILSKAGITNVPTSEITGNIGVSPIDSTAIIGFELVMDESNEYATSTQVEGRVYAADYAEPTPSELTTAVNDMEAAYTYAAGRAADETGVDLSDEPLGPGVYKWDAGVSINDNVTLDGEGDENAVWIFQISGTLTQAANTSINLTDGAQAENVFWQVTETVSIGVGADFAGIVLGKTDITLLANASVNGKLLAQTEVTLDQNEIAEPE